MFVKIGSMEVVLYVREQIKFFPCLTHFSPDSEKNYIYGVSVTNFLNNCEFNQNLHTLSLVRILNFYFQFGGKFNTRNIHLIELALFVFRENLCRESSTIFM